MKIVVALGGNALASAGHAGAAAEHREGPRARLRVAAESVAALAREHAVVVTHGNGPQVGLLALRDEAATRAGRGPGSDAARPTPLDVLGAESEGMIGYWIERELTGLLPDRDVATLLTQVEVDPDDPAFGAPTKPIGPRYPPEEAESLRARGWSLAETARPGGEGPGGRCFRRVVPSPEPRRIREIDAIRLLVDAGVVVVCAGGGGIPVVRRPDGGLRGVEAVIDKDLASALLARDLGADALLLLTDVEAVWLDWPEPRRRAVAEASPAVLREHVFDAGSMGPKVEAACRFVEAGGALAGIGALSDATRILAGRAGTRVRAHVGLALHPSAEASDADRG